MRVMMTMMAAFLFLISHSFLNNSALSLKSCLKASTMVKPKVNRTPTPSYLVLAVKILLVFVILFLLPKLVSGGRQHGRKKVKRMEIEMRSTRIICEKEICAAFIPEESMNCVLFCVSPACYETVYGEPLEDGEIDIPRAKEFDTCLKVEFRSLRKKMRTM
jgi:hypothetical protein